MQIKSIFPFIFILLFSLNCMGKENEVDPFVLSDLAKLKGAAERYMREEDPKEYNELRKGVDGLIDAIATFVEKGSIEERELQRIQNEINEINSKIKKFNEKHKMKHEMKYENKHYQLYNSLVPITAAVIPIITTTIEVLAEIHKKYQEANDQMKKDFIQRLEARKWEK